MRFGRVIEPSLTSWAFALAFLSAVTVTADDAYFSFQGTFTSPGVAQPFLVYSSNVGPFTISTLHQSGGANFAGETIAGGSFDPTLIVFGPDLTAFDNDSGPGLDARLTTTLPTPYQVYTVGMQPLLSNATGRWAVDMNGPPLLAVAPQMSGGSRIDSVTFGYRGLGGGNAALYYTPGSDRNALSQASVTIQSGGYLDLQSLGPADTVAVGSLNGTGVASLGNAALSVGGNGSSSTFSGPLYGAGRLIKTGGGVFELAGHSDTFSGDIHVAGGTLAIKSDDALGGTTTAQQIVFDGNGTLRRNSLFLDQTTVTLSPNRRLLVPAGATGALDVNGGQSRFTNDEPSAPGLLLSTPGQLSGSGSLSFSGGYSDFSYVVPQGGTEIAASNPQLTGDVRINGRVVLSSPAALGQSRVDVGKAGVLELKAPAALGAPATVSGRLEYRANGAAGGNLITVGPDGSGLLYMRPEATSTGNDQLLVRSGAAVLNRGGAPGVLKRGENLNLEPGAIVDMDTSGPPAQWAISNLGNAHDLWRGAINLEPTPIFGQVDLGAVTVGVTGDTPFKGITGRNGVRSSFDFYGTSRPIVVGSVTAVGDFYLRGINFGGTVNAAERVRAIPLDDVVLWGGQYNNVTVDVASSVTTKGFQASGLNIIGSVIGFVPHSISFRQPILVAVGSLTGEGALSEGNTLTYLTVGLEGASSTFSGDLNVSSFEKVGGGTFRIAGRLHGTYYQPFVKVSGGTLEIGASDLLTDTPVETAAGATLDLLGHDQRVDRLLGAGTVQLGGASLTVGTPTSFSPVDFPGSIDGAGSVTLYAATFTGINPFSGPLAVRGPVSIAPDKGFAKVNSVRLEVGGTLDLDYHLAPGVTSGTPIPTSTDILLEGGAIRISGADNQVVNQALGRLIPELGASTVEAAAGAGGSVTATFASLYGRKPGATVNFVGGPALGASNIIKFAQAPASTPPPAGFIGAWAIANGTDFARYDPVKGVVPFAPADYSTDAGGKHLLVTASNPSFPNNFDAYTLKIDASAADVNLTQPYTTLNLNKGGLLKIGSHKASISGPNATLSSGTSGELVVFTQGGDLTIGSRIAAPALTKSGDGTLALGAADRLPDDAVVTVDAGKFTLNGFHQKLATVLTNGGTFEISAPVLPAPLPGSPVAFSASPLGAAPTGASTPPNAEIEKVVMVDGTTVVRSSALLYVGLSGLTFRGGQTPAILLEDRGTLDLHGNIDVNDPNTRASITGSGNINLNGAKVFTQDPQAQLSISAPIENGSFEKAGQGTLVLSRAQSFNQDIGITVTGGLVDVTNPAAVASTTLTLKTGNLKFTLQTQPVDSTPTTISVPVRIMAAADATITAQEVRLPPPPGTPPFIPPPPATFFLGKLCVQNASHLTFTSPNSVQVQLTDVTLAAAANFETSNSVTVSGIITGPGTLTKSGAGTLALAGTAPNDFGPLASAVDAKLKPLYAAIVQGGTLELRNPQKLNAIRGNLQIKGGAVARLFASDQIADDAVIDLSGAGTRFDLNGFTETVGKITVGGGAQIVTGGGTLNAGEIGLSTGGSLIWNNSDASQLASVRELIKAGKILTTAPTDTVHAVGYALASEVLGPTGAQGGIFSQSVDATAVLARYTLAGDANLDGKVDFTDLVRLAQHYGAPSATWSAGDFNYDDVVNFDDLVKLAQNYNGALPAAADVFLVTPSTFNTDLAAAFAAVPEPTILAPTIIAACGLAARTRRRRSPRPS